MNQPASAFKPWIVMVGGFLGAGKTTLLLAAAAELEKGGRRSAIILNDQGDSLVDTELAALRGLRHGQVTGGCFCCKFSSLVDEINALLAYAPHVIFAEPVGSCTDISATTLLPLLEFGDLFSVAPFTVLVDPARAQNLLRENSEPNQRFLFEKQLQEADIVCFSKSDLGLPCPQIPRSSARQISAKTGQGVSAWLDEVLAGNLSAGSRVLDIDYEQYAQAEAALAWLNLRAEVEPVQPVSPSVLLGPLLERLDADFTAAGIAIVHLKAVAQASTGFVKASICANGQDPEVEGDLAASPARKHNLLLNLRALGGKDPVREIVERNLQRTNARIGRCELRCFHPAPPKPERRVIVAPRGFEASESSSQLK